MKLKKLFNFTLAIVLLALYFAIAPAEIANAGVYEQYVTGDDGDNPFGSGVWIAQTFTPSLGHFVSRVSLKMSRSANTTDNITVQLRGVTGNNVTGKPNGNIYLSTNFSSANLVIKGDIPNGSWYEVNFGSFYAVAPGTLYAIVVGAPNSAGSAYNWRVDSTAPLYNGGCYAQSGNNGVTWGDGISGKDLLFAEGEYVGTVPFIFTDSSPLAYATNNVTLGLTVYTLGSANITEWGFWVGTSSNNLTYNPHSAVLITTVGHYTLNTSFPYTANTTYYYQAYGINSAGSAGGEIRSFNSASLLGVPPAVTTLYYGAGNIGSNVIALWGSVNNSADLIPFNFGFQWGNASNNLTHSAYAIAWTAGGDDKTFVLTLDANAEGLISGQTYYYQAYATNSHGTGLGAIKSFVYQSTAYVVSEQASNILLTIGNFTITFDVTVSPIADASDVYVRLSTTQNFTDNVTVYQRGSSGNVYGFSTWNGTGTNIGQALPNTTYYWQGYAIINGIYYWGGGKSFNTPLISNGVIGGGSNVTMVKPLISMVRVDDVTGSYIGSKYIFQPIAKVTQFTSNVTGDITSDFISYYGFQWSTGSNFLPVWKQLSNTLQPDGSYSLVLKFDSFYPTNAIYSGQKLYFRAYIKTLSFDEFYSNIVEFQPIPTTITSNVTVPNIPVNPVTSIKAMLNLNSWQLMFVIILCVALVFGIGMATTQGIAKSAVAVSWIVANVGVVGAFILTGELGIVPILIAVGSVVALVVIFVSIKLSGGGQSV